MSKLHVLLSVQVIILISCTTPTFTQDIDHTGESGLKGKIDSIVIHKMNEYDIPGLSIGVIKNDSVYYTNGYGFRNIRSKDPVTQNSVFHTASVSKLFTAMAVMQLVKKEKLSLNDKLVVILPNLRYTDKRVEQITVLSLLNHTSGLPDISNYHWENNNESHKSLSEYILGQNLKLDSDPSTVYGYSNLGYDILGLVVEKATNSPFDEYVKQEILNPGKMANSDFRYFEISDSLKTTPHSKRLLTNKIYTREIYPYTREHSPSSTLNSSAVDLSNWMKYFLELLEEDVYYQSMLEPSEENNSHIGLGFQLYDMGAYRAIGHYGGDKGFRSFLMMIPEERIGLVVLGNCDYNEDFRQEILMPLAVLMRQQ